MSGKWRAGRGVSRRAWIGIGLALMLAGGIAAALVVLVPGGATAPRARQYLSYTACLLTGPDGVAGAPAAQAWAGLEDASAATLAKAEYLPVFGKTAAAAEPYLASLVQRHCGVVVAVGAAQAAAVADDAGRFAGVRFVVVGGQAGPAAAPNVTLVDPASGRVRAAVAQLVTTDVHAMSQAPA